ncbi:MAG: hypothetical protein V4548_05285 [Bacteroidota bacterium]
MKKAFLLFNFLFFFSCGYHSKKVILSQNIEYKDTLIYSVSAKILEDNYRADYRSNMFLYIINSKNDTLIAQREEGLSPVPLIFEDFNNDNLLDIRYGYNSNYFFEMILLFDPKTKQFVKINGIDSPDYAYSENIKGTELYYSYTPDGCGKNNWISNLFLVKDFKIIPIGIIKYKQCMDDEKGVYVYSISEEKETLMTSFSIIEANRHRESFFKYYWKKNYKKFI